MPHPLLLVPTGLERRVIEPVVTAAAAVAIRIELCGFGPVVAAARTAALIAAARPERVLLVGIAGRLDERLAIGSAYRFDQVACYGIGIGSCANFSPAAAIGWPQWPGDPADGSPAIGDLIECAAEATAGAESRLLLTACAASASADDVRDRRRLFPTAAAEDMEGFAVAFACRLQGMSCHMVRGISNAAGDREKSRWRTAAALEAAGTLAAQTIAGMP